MSDIEGKAVTGNSERAWVANEFQSRKLKAKLALASVQLVTLPDQCIHDVPVLGLLHRSMILVRSLRRAMPKSIREDSERGVVVIDGVEISGWLDTERCCSQCGSVRVYHDALRRVLLSLLQSMAGSYLRRLILRILPEEARASDAAVALAKAGPLVTSLPFRSFPSAFPPAD